MSGPDRTEAVIEPLDRLPVGDTARVVYIVPRDPERLVRLAGVGLIPGAELRLVLQRPATVLALGETTLAIEREIASEIFVTRLPG